MAEVFWLRDGKPSDHHMSRAHHVPMNRLLEVLTPFEKRYYDVPPSFNAHDGPASSSAPYRYVLVKVPEEEVNSTFPDEGYYHVTHVEPEDLRRLLRLSEHP